MKPYLAKCLYILAMKAINVINDINLELTKLTLYADSGSEDTLLNLFTHSRANIASKLCFDEVVYADFKREEGSFALCLSKKNKFSYEEIEKIAILCKKKFRFEGDSWSNLFRTAISCLPHAGDKVFCFIDKCLSCYVRVSDGQILDVHFVDPCYQSECSNNMGHIIESLQNRVLGCNYVGTHLEVFGCRGMMHTINGCLEVLLSHSLLGADDFEKVQDKLVNIAYKEFVKQEYNKLKHIHDLSVDEGIDVYGAQSMDFFIGLLQKMCGGLNQLSFDEEQVIARIIDGREGGHKKVPEFVQRCFIKLRENFSWHVGD